jgi:hypothetical protein
MENGLNRRAWCFHEKQQISQQKVFTLVRDRFTDLMPELPRFKA